jgi:hypothetical protein
VPSRRRKARDIDIGAGERVLQKLGVADRNGRQRAQSLAFLHPRFECVEWPQSRVQAQRQRRPLHIGGGVGEYPHAVPVSLDAIEQECRAIGPSGRHFGDTADFEERIGAVDAAQCPQPVDKIDELAQVFVHCVETGRSLPRSREEFPKRSRCLATGTV